MVKLAGNKFLWQDKLDFAQRIVNKELEMVSQFTAVINNLRYNQYPLDRINELTQYKYCWANINNLYDILREDYKDQLSKEELEKLDGLMDSYQDIEKGTDIKDLKEAKKLILKMMSKSGFHDLIRRGEEGDFDTEED